MPRRDLRQGLGPRATNRTLLTWMLWFQSVVSTPGEGGLVGKRQTFGLKEQEQQLPPCRPVTHQVWIKAS